MSDVVKTLTLAVDMLVPNPWNPNVMSPAMYAKELASIRRFGFIDPVAVRRMDTRYQIIDGENRVRAAIELHIGFIPCIVLDVDDDEARELTIILNELHGQPDEDRLSELMADLAKRRDRARLEESMPYDEDRLAQLIDRRQIDWSDLDRKREQVKASEEEKPEPWVERVYRLPRSSASVIDDAVARVQEAEGLKHPWQALEMIAADSLSGS